MTVSVTYAFQLVQNLDLVAGPAIGNVDVTPLANGGFAAVGDSGNVFSTFATLDFFNANGTLTGGQSAPIGYSGAATDQLSNGNIVVVSTGSDNAGYLSILAGNGTFVRNLDFFTTTSEATNGIDVAALTGGNFVAVASSSTGTVAARICNNAGTELLYITVDEDRMFDPVVAALDDGGFAIAWSTVDGAGSNLYCAVYNANGSVRTPRQTFETSMRINTGDMDITATDDGFAIVYQTDAISTNTDIGIARFNANGGLLNKGTLTGPATIDETPQIARMAGGLLAVTFGFSNLSTADSETDLIIFDPVTNAVVAERTITSGQPLTDDTDFATLASHGVDRIAVFHTNRTNGDAEGEELRVVRTSNGDGADDFLFGSVYTDTFNGGGGADQVTYSSAISAVTVSLAVTAVQNVGGGQGLDTLISIENLSGSDFADSLTGNSSSNLLLGGFGNDRLDGGSGIDTMLGEAGSDVYYANVFNDIVGEDNGDLLSGGNDIVYFTGTSGTFTLSANVERLTLTGTAAINGTGNNLANIIYGNTGANILDSGVDLLTDTLIGGLGNDTYIIHSATDNIVENAGQGTADRARTGVSFALAAGDNIEFLETANAALTTAINLTGNEIAQTITGNAGANVLKGGFGRDILDGLGGNDTADFSDKTTAVVVTLAGAVTVGVSVGGVIEDSIRNIENLIGGSTADTLNGDEFANILNGGADNVGDTLYGRLGNDTYVINSATDDIVENSGAGTADRARCSISFTLAVGDNIEFLETTNVAGYGAINLTGNEIAQMIIGNEGKNVLNGGIDNFSDTLVGGFGDDTYIINTVNDNIVELDSINLGDRAKCSVSFTLGAGDSVEFLETTNPSGTAAINLFGNEIAQTITGNAGANVLGGGVDSLSDTLIGGLGNDQYVINSANDIIVELNGQGTADRVLANISYALAAGVSIEIMTTANAALTTAINLIGNEFAQTIGGNAGSNLLSGGGGNDTLAGGLGNDAFLFNSFPYSSTNRDTITDFNVAADTILLQGSVFFGATAAGGGLGELSALQFKNLTTGGAVDLDDRILYNDATGALFYDSDGSGAGTAIQFATLTGSPTVFFNDFVVI